MELVPGQSVTVNVDSIAAVVDDTQNNFYVNPYAAAKGTWVGIGAGVAVVSGGAVAVWALSRERSVEPESNMVRLVVAAPSPTQEGLHLRGGQP